MRLSDLFEVGSALAESGAAIRTDRQFKQMHPDDYPIFQQLGIACMESGFNFKLAPDKPIYFATALVRGLLYQPEMKCIVYVEPSSQQLEILYVPDEAVFARSDERVRTLLNWVNSQLYFGRFVIDELGETPVRKDLLRLAYRAAVSYAGVDQSQIRRLAGNMLLELAGFYDLFIPATKALSEGKLFFDVVGGLGGPAAAQILSLQSSGRQRLGKAVKPGALDHLRADLQRRLSDNKIAWEAQGGSSMLRLKQLDVENDRAWHYAYVTDLGEVVFEARSRWTAKPDRRRAVIGSKYLLFLNYGWTDTGAYFLDLANNQVVCRAGFNAQRMENQLSAIQIKALVDSFTRMACRLGDLRQVAQPSVSSQGEGEDPSLSAVSNATDIAIAAAVQQAMTDAEDPEAVVYWAMRVDFDQDIGVALEDIGL